MGNDCIFEGVITMPYDLPLPDNFKPWKVKIFDNELLEEPHVTIIFKMTRWRFSLRSKKFLDKQPDPGDVRNGISEEIEAHFEILCREWDVRFPTNPVHQQEEEL
jgi:hypothetical protein